MFDKNAQNVLDLRNELLDHIHNNYSASVEIFDIVVAFSSIASQIAYDTAPTKRHAKSLLKTGLNFGKLVLEETIREVENENTH